MADSKSVSSSAGPGLATLLTVLFVGLRLTDQIDWSWWWVLSPIWISALLVVAFIAVSLPVFLWTERRKR